MLPEERLAAGDLAGEGFAQAVVAIRDMHGAIARRAFRSVGAACAPAEVVHDAVAGVAYGATGLAGRSLLALAGRGAGWAAGPDAAPIDDAAAGRFVRAALNGVLGDLLEARGNALAVRMAVRAAGRDVGFDPGDLRRAFPVASGRIAVFLHGLGEAEGAWRLGAGRRRPYGERLRDELGYTPVYIRYNSGLHVSENGRRLSRLLDQLVAAWPVEVGEIVLVGHSMGGLVARSACHYGAGRRWTDRVAHVVTLGTPHAGAPLERGAHAIAWALRRLPETRALARPLHARSAGIRDLGHGYVTDECWSGQDPGAFLRHAARDIPFLERASHYFVSASLSADPNHPLGRYIGDLLVLHGSAWGAPRRGERLRFPLDSYRHVGGANHFDLLNHPAIADQLVRWLTVRPQLTAA